MRIFNETKTYEFTPEQVDYEKGYLKPDKLFVAHHEAVEAKEAVYKDRVEHLPNSSTQIYKDLVSPAVEAKDAYDEYEDIQVFVPFTAEELKEKLRSKRTSLLNAFDKWEKAVLRGRESDDYAIMAWYKELLDLKETAFANVPVRIQYYL